jgi:high frequency lysogenization protein
VSERLGALYAETLSTLRPRVMVPGSVLHLEQPRTVARIRTLLLASVRAAVLWRQVGGTRWGLLLRRGRICEASRRLHARALAPT